MIVERYIHREILLRVVWIAGLLFLIFASNKFVDFLADAAAGKLPIGIIMNMLWLKMLSIQPTLLPITLFLAVLLAYARLARDNELAVMATSGIGKTHQLKIVSRITFILCLIVAVITFFVAPWAESETIKLKINAQKDADITGISAGKFREFSQGDRVVYVESVSDDKRSMQNVFLQVRQKEKLGVLTSDSAKFDVDEESGNRYIIFEDGRRYIGKPGMLDYQISEYQKYGVLIETENVDSIAAKLNAVPTSVLLVSDLPQHRAELQWRISSIIACFLLALLAVLLNQFSLGQKPYLLIFISVLAYFLYSNLLGISRTLLKRDDISPYLGLWWVHLILIIIMIVLFYFPTIMQLRRKDNKLQVLSAKK